MDTKRIRKSVVAILVVVLLTVLTGGVIQPRLAVSQSPTIVASSVQNGRIAFDSKRDGNDEIYVMNADGSEQTRLTNNLAGSGGPAWSPDGRKIAFYSCRDGNDEIYVMNADGTGQTNLTNNTTYDWQPAWSPDGTKIAFVSYRDGNLEIYVMNSDGLGVRRLTNNSANDVMPAWSPDGTKIAFVSCRDGNFEIYVMNADGSGVTRLTNNPAYDGCPAWGTALVCPAPSGLDVCALLPGDILLKRGSMDLQCAGAEEREWIEDIGGTYFTHSALYVGNLMVAEAAGYACGPLELCDRSDEVHEIALQLTQFWTGKCVTDWAVVRPQASGTEKQIAINYAVAKAREEGVVFAIAAPRDTENAFYCAKLVWSSYKEAGVEVEASSGLCTIDLAYFITPDDLYFGSSVVQESSPPWVERLKAFVCSPVHLTLVDSGGRRTGFDPATGGSLREIPGAIYSGSDALVETVTLREMDGDLRLLAVGFDSGEYTLATEYVDDGQPVAQSFTGVTYPGKEDWFIVSDPVTVIRLYLPFVMYGH